MIHAVIFDHDGTLVDSEGRHFELWRDVVKPFGVDFQQEEYIQEHSGIPTLQNAEALIKKYHLPIDAPALLALKEQHVRESLQGEVFPLIPNVIECMQSFQSANIPMGIATGASAEEVASSCDAHGFRAFVTYAASSDQVAAGKPAPDVYLLAAEKLRVKPENCIAIEDSNTGLQAALAAGMQCLIVRNPWSAAAAYTGASAIFDSILQARDWIVEKHRSQS